MKIAMFDPAVGRFDGIPHDGHPPIRIELEIGWNIQFARRGERAQDDHGGGNEETGSAGHGVLVDRIVFSVKAMTGEGKFGCEGAKSASDGHWRSMGRHGGIAA